jgi:hypothetical protein
MANGITDLVRLMMRPDRAVNMAIILPQITQAAMNTGGVAGTHRQKNKPATASTITMSKSMTSEVNTPQKIIWRPIQLTT